MNRAKTTLLFLGLGMGGIACAQEVAPKTLILFVCEHGNAKSLMAANYFNRLAEQRKVSIRAIARGIAPDASTVPPGIVEGLKQEGFDASGFHPFKVEVKDVGDSLRVIVISTLLPLPVASSVPLERWNDVPPASEDFPASSRALRRHIEALLDQLAPAAR